MRSSARPISVTVSLLLVFALAALMPGAALATKKYTSAGVWPSAIWLREPGAVAVDGAGNVYVADTLNDKVKKLSSTGALLATWGGSGTSDGRLSRPDGIAVDGAGNVYVADTGNHRIQRFTSSGGFLGKWGTLGSGDGQFRYPSGVAVDTAGSVYVADTDNDRIQKFTASGSFVMKWGSHGGFVGQLRGPQGIAVSTAGAVYVADTNNHRIHRFTTTGGFSADWTWGPFEAGPDSSGRVSRYTFPSDVALDSLGNVYVANTNDNQIEKCDGDGNALATWGTLGLADGSFSVPEGVAVQGSGTVWVADTGNDRIQALTTTGLWQKTFSARSASLGRLAEPSDAAVDAAGNVYVADTGNNRVQKFSSAGAYLASWGSSGTATGQFRSPSSVALDAAGNVYVADTGNNRIQKFTSAGAFVSAWGAAGISDGLFNGPRGITLDSSGNVYVADTGNDRVQKFSSTGAFLAKWGNSGSTDGKFLSPTDVAVDGLGYVYVADTYNHRLQKFTTAGAFNRKWGSFGPSDGQFNAPQGVLVLADGNVLVSDTGNVRIQEFTANGTFSVSWGVAGDEAGQLVKPVGLARTGTTVYVVEAGNHRVQKLTYTVLDETPPTTSASGVPAEWVSTDVTVTLSATDDLSGVASTHYRLGTGPISTYSGPVKVSQHGPTTMAFSSLDKQGNAEPTKTVTVRIDKVTPFTAVTGVSREWGTSNVTLTLHPGDDLSGVKATYYRVGSDPLSPYKGPITVNRDGATPVQFFSVDQAGNWEATKTATARIDRTPPKTTSSLEPRWRVHPIQLVLTAEDSGSGVQTTYYRMGSGTAKVYTGPVTISAEGLTAVSFWSVDKLGNVEATQSATAMLCTTGPVTNCDFADGWSSEPVTVTLEAASALPAAITATYYKLGNGAATQYSEPFVVTDQGITRVTYWSQDASGNVETPKTADVKIITQSKIDMRLGTRGTIAYNQATRLVGWFPGGGGQRVGFQKSSDGRGWRTIRYVTVSSSGWVVTYDRPTQRTYYRISFPGTESHTSYITGSIAVRPRAWLSGPYAPTYMSRSRGTLVYGFIKPRHGAGTHSVRLYCYRYESGKWRLRKIYPARNDNYSSYTKYLRYIQLPYTGRWRIRAYHSDWWHAPTWSGYDYVTVR